VIPLQNFVLTTFPLQKGLLGRLDRLVTAMVATEGRAESIQGTVGEISQQFGMRSGSLDVRRYEFLAVGRKFLEVGCFRLRSVGEHSAKPLSPVLSPSTPLPSQRVFFARLRPCC
jgi:hypothetical protein